jgi:hypothetical protein
VPKYIRKQQGQGAEAYARSVGYREVDGGEGGSRLESGDEYSSRLQGYVLLYAAITQVWARVRRGPGRWLPRAPRCRGGSRLAGGCS